MLFNRKESWPLQAYGKLELAKDYLRVGCSAGGGLRLRDWLDRGFSAGDHEDQVRLAWPARFLWGAGSPLAGVAFPSSDAGGLRKFPFAVFVERRKRALVEDCEEGLALAAALWEHLDGHYRARANFSDGQGYIRALRGLTVEPGGMEPHEPEPVLLDDWLEALWPEEGGAGLRALLTELAELARSGYQGPLRLPLAAGLPYRDQVSAWRTALLGLELLDEGRVHTLFFPQEPQVDAAHLDEPPFLALLPERVETQHAAWLGSSRSGPLAPRGDFAAREVRGAKTPAIATENTPSLADSIRGALAGITG